LHGNVNVPISAEGLGFFAQRFLAVRALSRSSEESETVEAILGSDSSLVSGALEAAGPSSTMSRRMCTRCWPRSDGRKSGTGRSVWRRETRTPKSIRC